MEEVLRLPISSLVMKQNYHAGYLRTCPSGRDAYKSCSFVKKSQDTPLFTDITGFTAWQSALLTLLSWKWKGALDKRK